MRIGQYILCALVIACGFAKAQDTLIFKVLGSVVNVTDRTVVPNCNVVLKGSDGTLVQTKTDPKGNYEMKLKPEVNYDIYASPDKTIKTPTAKTGFLASDDHGTFSTVGLKETQNFQKDFELKPELSCGPAFASINFVKNSVSYEVHYGVIDAYTDSMFYKPSFTIQNIANMLKKNLPIVMQISGHCDDEEKFPASLSLQRAEKVKQDLIQLGIPAARLIAKGYGADKLRYDNEALGEEENKEKRNEMIAANRRCIVSILNWDYVEPNAKKVETPAYTKPSDEK